MGEENLSPRMGPMPGGLAVRSAASALHHFPTQQQPARDSLDHQQDDAGCYDCGCHAARLPSVLVRALTALRLALHLFSIAPNWPYRTLAEG